MIPFLGTPINVLRNAQDSAQNPRKAISSTLSAFGGYSGLFRMPTTEVTNDGQMTFGIGTGKIVPNLTVFQPSPQSDNYSATVGFLPGLEVGLSFLTPSLFNGITEDRTVSAKYRIPLPSSTGWSVAIGSTDVQGTRRRATDYVVAGKQLGLVTAYLGAARGEFKGAMGGVSLRINSYVALAAERTRSLSIGGVRANWKNLSATVGLDQNRRTIAGAGYAICLGRTHFEPEGKATDSPFALANRLGEIAHGDAHAELVDDEIRASYEDVDARHPVQTLAAALHTLVESSTDAKRVRLTVMRFGVALVTLSGRIDQIRSYLQGYSDDREFLQNVKIESAKDASNSDDAPPALSTLVSVAPVLHYQLGVQDKLPNSEGLRFRSFTSLPFGLVGATLAEVNVNNSFGTRGNAPQPTFGLYKIAPAGNDLQLMGGLEKNNDLRESGAIEFSYRPSHEPFWIEGGYRRSFSSQASTKDRRFIGAGINVDPTLYLWVRNEKFQAGDVGNSFGASRRFGDLRLNFDVLKTRDPSGGSIHRLGVVFQIPLPDYGINYDRIRVATANYGEFSYHPTVHATATLGRGVSPTSVLSLADDIQGRRDLTAQYVRESIKQLRYK